MTIDAFRLENTRRLIAKVGGPAEFAEQFGKSDSQVAQFAGRNPSRNIGKSLARQIEKAFGLEHGELDRPPPKSPLVEEAAAELERRPPEAQQHVLAIIKSIPPALAASALPPIETPPNRSRKRR